MAESDGLGQANIWGRLRGLGRGLVLAGGLFLAACQTIVPKGTGPEQPAPPPPAPVQPGLPTDTQRHRIALLVPTTGPNAGVGQSIANATTLALLDTQAKNVRITTYDTGKGAAAAAARAVADGNRLILGPLTGDEVKATAPAARKANIPIISFSNDASIAGNGVYIMGYSPAQSVERVVGYARSRGMSKFAALVPAGVYGERAGTAMLRAVEASGGTVIAMETFQRSAGSLSAAVKKLPSGYDAVLIADGGRIALQAAPLIRQGGGAQARLLGTELWNTEESTIAASPALRGAWFASVSDNYYRQLATKYRARFKTAPYRLSALGYDAVLLTVRIAQNWKVDTAFPVSSLNDKGGFAGIDGAFRFDRDGVADRALEVQQVDAGKFTVIDAAPRGF
ncbi:penicillin-binding protein activator [Sphingobium jiangsuense]|uniref:ABC-type branched-subunit amino acid transport system substrate-binding protein n=1 Tax=Sphingobium jiangsuense TaxID=870476 RepID=A0A7W6FRH7_9SPHN|nr:penicillin-binding protein activator [Sphingobium jiangsuense]MBB3927717.1 ABC-type branched-subunit amino acid transport system substrate-binding protein [Sphingobium jiangsuense]GLT01222.1 penicillin-binding protein activator [Sphingobium jiangsuense]